VKARRPWLVAALAIAALVAALGLWWNSRPAEAPTASAISSNPAGSNSVSEPKSAAIKPDPSDPLSTGLLAARASLQDGQDAGKSRQQLAELRQALASADAAAASVAIRRFLDSGTDSPTGDVFRLGPGGSLVGAPSLRVFLLDLLAKIDPQAAVTYSKQILETPGSPDEWAVALRIIARLDSAPDTKEFLEQKTVAMLHQESWASNPSTGFLEAFDVAVHLGGIKLLPPLTSFVQQKDNQAVAHAAFLALDRMVIREPATMLDELEQHPELLQGREETRANYFARADVGEAAQRRLVESYMLDATRSPTELNTFAGIFPNANYMISQNLLTENITPDRATLARRDVDALRVVGEWLSDPRFASLKPQLLKIQQRLQEFVRQAAASR